MDLFGNQKVEINGKVIYDFSGSPGDIYSRRLYVDNNQLNEALMKLVLVNRETDIKLIIETI